MYEFFDHTADLGIHVESARLEDIYAEAAEALFAVICDEPESIKSMESRRYQITGGDRAILLFDWLRTALLAFETDGWLLHHADVTIGDEGLTIAAYGEPFDPNRHPLGHEVKAITYHGLRVERHGNGWMAEVIVDI